MIEMTPAEQAIRYLSGCPPAVSGADGHGTAFGIVCAVVNGFALGEEDAMRVLAPWNATCQPPWSESELRHKVKDAMRVPHTEPRGSKITKARAALPPPASHPAAPPPPAKYALTHDDLPEPLPDGARALLRVCFAEGDGICIAPADLNDEGREIPDGGGIVLSREEWLRRLDAKSGDPNGIFSSTARTGIYIRCNPMKLGGAKDEDVTAFRHVLIEFDSISQEEQWNLYHQSNIPVAAIIDSGGKSVHAWVRVDARDRREYDERVGQLYDHFAAYNPDRKNRNPSRFSRMPGCVRFSRRQELLQLGGGAENFTEWLKGRQHDSLGPCLDFGQLLDLDTSADPGCVVGFADGKTTRYLCRGKSAWLIGPSGIGKSTLLAEFAIGWAAGNPVFGIAPRGPLKSLIVQAENDDYDIAEMVQGIARAHGMDWGAGAVGDNVKFKTESTCIRQEFCLRLQRLIDREKPDIVWADPLLSFAGIDVTKQDQATEFLRQMLQPVLEATGAVLIGVHHTGKPKAARDVAQWTAIDHAYSGIGSSELVNWARAVMVLVPHGDTFELKLAKRGGRAGAMHPDGTRAWDSVWLRHGQGCIRWEQIMPPAEPEKPQKHTREELLSIVPEGGELTKTELLAFAGEAGIGKNRARDLLAILLKQGLLSERKEKREGTQPEKIISRKPSTSPP